MRARIFRSLHTVPVVAIHVMNYWLGSFRAYAATTHKLVRALQSLVQEHCQRLVSIWSAP